MMRNKKAQYGLYDFIFQIVVIVGTIAAVFMYVNHAAGSTTYARLYISRELAFGVSAGYAAPEIIYYEALYYFPVDMLLKFDYRLKEGVVDVSDARYYYARDSCFIERGPEVIRKTKRMWIENSNYDLFFGKDLEGEDKLKYPFVDTLDYDWKAKKFVIIPEKYIDFFKGAGLRDVSASPSSNMTGYFYFNVSKEKPKEIKILIPVKTALQSRKLASIIVNKFLDVNRTLEISVGFSKDVSMNKANVSAGLIVGANVTANAAGILLDSLENYYEVSQC